MASKRCPRCRLVNPGSAQLCDCGYSFATGEMTDVAGAPSGEVTPTQSVRQVGRFMLYTSLGFMVLGLLVTVAVHSTFGMQAGGGLAIVGVVGLGLARMLFRSV